MPCELAHSRRSKSLSVRLSSIREVPLWPGSLFFFFFLFFWFGFFPLICIPPTHTTVSIRVLSSLNKEKNIRKIISKNKEKKIRQKGRKSLSKHWPLINNNVRPTSVVYPISLPRFCTALPPGEIKELPSEGIPEYSACTAPTKTVTRNSYRFGNALRATRATTTTHALSP